MSTPIAIALSGAVMLAAAGAQAQTCRQSSYIPGLSPLVLQNAGGATVAFRRGVQAGQPTVHVWINGQYTGQHTIPLSLAGGEIQVLLHSRMRLETWLGSVRQAYKPVPYLVVCGRDWQGNLP